VDTVSASSAGARPNYASPGYGGGFGA
jgi:hypothetical protein